MHSYGRDMKLVAARDVTTIVCFRRVCVLMEVVGFCLCFVLQYQNFLKFSLRTLLTTGKVCFKNKVVTHTQSAVWQLWSAEGVCSNSEY